MRAPELFLTATIVFVTLALLSLVELAVPLVRRTPAHPGRLATNLGLTGLTVTLNWALMSAAAIGALALARQTPGLMTRLGVPYAGQIVVGFVVIDFSFGYLAHRAMHWSPTLWRAHRIHHCDPFVDATTALRNHPIEGVWRSTCLLAPAWALGIPAEVVLLHRLLTVVNGSLEHANVRLWPPLERALSLFWVTPNMHKVHHSRERVETDSNYGNLLSIYDRMLRTFTPTDGAFTVVYGLDDVDPVRATSLRTLLAMPFRAAKSSAREPVVAPPLRGDRELRSPQGDAA